MSRSVAQARQNRCLALSRSVFAVKMTLWPESGSNLARSGRKFSYGYVFDSQMPNSVGHNSQIPTIR